VANPENLLIPTGAGRYRLYGIIAAGGMATVHYGRMHSQLGFARTVAIKRLHREYARDPEFVAMFMDEARLAVRVHHPNVVETLDVFASGGELFLVMEYVPAVALSLLLDAAKTRGEFVPSPVAAAVVADVLRGLHAAHEATDEAGNPLDIVHRDVSPQNILVGADGCARVLDFGVAKASGRQQMTRDGQMKGKLAYMSPEQITNVFVTRQSDVFAASIVLWETLTGARLFQGESASSVLARVLTAPIEPPSALVAGLETGLDAIALRGLARDPSVRYATGREMALDLEAHAALASASHVGQWVERLAGDELGQRAAEVAQIESESRSERVSVGTFLAATANEPEIAEPPNEAARAPERHANRGRLALLAGAALGTAVAAGVLLVGLLRPSRAIESTGHSATLDPVPAALSPPESSVPVFLVPAPSPAGPALPPKPTSAGKPRISKSTSAPSATEHASGSSAESAKCDPPYYVDSSGHLIYKPECFR
jgi:eukaryotic-like serine/threonine-protein kinase